MTTFNLRTLKLRSGEQFVDEREIAMEPLVLAGQRYLPVPSDVPVELGVTRASTGTVFELRFTTRLHGPCFRCLADAVLEIPISAREYEATSPEASDELRTPYLVDGRLDLSAWARDALALELPAQLTCREDCAGLCPHCGERLAPGRPHDCQGEQLDTRWDRLRDLL
jgi:uncharacterized protein